MAVTLLAENLGSDFLAGGVAVDAAGNVFVGNRAPDQGSKTPVPRQIVKVSPAGVVTNFLNVGNFPQFELVTQLIVNPASQALYAVKQSAWEPTGIVSVTADGYGSRPSMLAILTHPTGTFTQWSINMSPYSIAAGADGTLYASTSGQYIMGTASSGFRVVQAVALQTFDLNNGGRLVFAQENGVKHKSVGPIDDRDAYTYPGSLSATGGFLGSYQLGLAIDSKGDSYIADTSRHAIIKVSASGAATLFAGAATVPGSADGNAGAARFKEPTQLVMDKADNLYVLDSGNFTVRKITQAGVVTTVAGVAGQSQTKTGALPGGLGAPAGLAIDGSGRLYVTVDKGLLRIRLH